MSERQELLVAGLEALLAAVHAGDPKREILVRVGDAIREAKALVPAQGVQDELAEWKQAASVEANLRREFFKRAEEVEEQLALADALIATHANSIDSNHPSTWPKGSILAAAVRRHGARCSVTSTERGYLPYTAEEAEVHIEGYEGHTSTESNTP